MFKKLQTCGLITRWKSERKNYVCINYCLLYIIRSFRYYRQKFTLKWLKIVLSNAWQIRKNLPRIKIIDKMTKNRIIITQDSLTYFMTLVT